MPYKDPNDPRAKAARQRWLAQPGNKEKKRTYMRGHGLVYNKRYYEQHREMLLEKAKEGGQRRRANQEVVAGRKRPEICDACGGLPGKHRFHFDHCHARGHFRGWLCGPCNRILGLAQDSPKRLLQLAAYLQRTHTNTSPQLSLAGI